MGYKGVEKVNYESYLIRMEDGLLTHTRTQIRILDWRLIQMELGWPFVCGAGCWDALPFPKRALTL